MQLNINSKLAQMKFNQGHESYLKHNNMQKFAAKQLIEYCQLYRCDLPKQIVDLGCGHGDYHNQLFKVFTKSVILGIDITPAMLWRNEKTSKNELLLIDSLYNHTQNNRHEDNNAVAARQNKYHSEDIIDKETHVTQQRHAICANGEYLPLASNSVDIIFANMYLHWLPNFITAMNEIRRILKKEGLFFFTTLSNQSFVELRQAWRPVDSYEHVNPFFTIAQLFAKINGFGFHLLHQQDYYYCDYFKDMVALMYHCKYMAASNSHTASRKGLTTAKQLQRVYQYYECFRNKQGLLPLNYHIIMAALRKI